MRAITVRQPWAWAIVHGGKDVENRTRNIAGRYRGLVAIHAGLSTTAPWTAANLGKMLESWTAWRLENGVPGGHRGHLIGVVDLVDVHATDWPTMDRERMACCASKWAEGPVDDDGVVHHLTLANPRPLATPVPAKGRLGLWTLPDDVEAAVLAQLGAVA